MCGVQKEMDQTLYPRIYVERTLALVKPDAIHKAEEIEDIILKSGFTILQVGQNALEISSNVRCNVRLVFF